jgi:hypothetical protein
MELRRYRVRTPMRGVYTTGPCKGFISIPIGAMLVRFRDRNESAMYVNVQWNHRDLLVFPQDLTERAVECDVLLNGKPKAAGNSS